MDEDPTEPATGTSWRLVIAIATILVGLSLYRLLPTDTAGPVSESLGQDAETATVTVVVRQPDADTTRATVPWLDGQTVAQATQEAGLEAVWRGSGEMAFLESLAGVANQGGDGLNWQFEVNDDYADRGAGAVTLRPGDRVLWKLAPYE